MKKLLSMCVAVLGLVMLVTSPGQAATGKEEAFISSYKKAFEGKDEKTLTSFLYTKGADPEILEFYTMMMTAEMGSKIKSIDLVDLTAEDKKKASEMQELPSGGPAKLPLTPSKKLVLNIETSDASGTSNSSSVSFVAEHDGKYVIPVPGPAK